MIPQIRITLGHSTGWRAWQQVLDCSRRHCRRFCARRYPFLILHLWVIGAPSCFLFKYLTITCCSSTGRILSRLSKDQDTLDNELAGTLNQVGRLVTKAKADCAHIVTPFAVFGIVQFRPWHYRLGVLYFPIPWAHLCASNLALRFCLVILSPHFCGDKTVGLCDAIDLIWFLLRYDWSS